jgi:hypothetical protein
VVGGARRGSETILTMGGSFLQTPSEGKWLPSPAGRADPDVGVGNLSMGIGGPPNKQGPVAQGIAHPCAHWMRRDLRVSAACCLR